MLYAFLRLYANATVISICWAVAWFALVSSMLHKNIYVKRCVLFCLCFWFIQMLYNTAYQFFPFLWENHFIEGVVYTLHGFFLVLFQPRKGKEDNLITASSVALGYFFIYNFFYAAQVFFGDPLEKSALDPDPWVYSGTLILMYGTVLIFSLLMSFLLRKVHFRRYWAYLFNSRAKSVLTLLVCLLLMHSYRITLFFIPDLANSIAYSVTAMLSIFVIALVLLFLAVFENHRARLAAQAAQMHQQEAYVQSLESLQGEVRAFRHDYQNMMTGLFLQAEEGDMEGVQTQLRQKLQYFDDHLAGEIRQATHLANIREPQVKSLLVVKLQAMQQAGVACALEVVHPVTQLGMEAEDFLRVLGVFLDNAAEAAGQAQEPFVGALLFAEEGALHIAVKNSFGGEAPDAGEVWKDGYSTKGQGRGTGLAGVRRILERYGNVASRTALEEGFFLQELTIRLGGAS